MSGVWGNGNGVEWDSRFRVDRLTELGSPLVAEWQKTKQMLDVEYTLTKENMEYLSTIVEYLAVNAIIRFLS